MFRGMYWDVMGQGDIYLIICICTYSYLSMTFTTLNVWGNNFDARRIRHFYTNKKKANINKWKKRIINLTLGIKVFLKEIQPEAFFRNIGLFNNIHFKADDIKSVSIYNIFINGCYTSSHTNKDFFYVIGDTSVLNMRVVKMCSALGENITRLYFSHGTKTRIYTFGNPVFKLKNRIKICRIKELLFWFGWLCFMAY